MATRREWRLFRHHREQGHYRIVDPGQSTVDRAAALLFRHPIRAYDAVQIASALDVAAEAGSIVDFRFVTADQNQATAAGAEGLTVDFVP
jgi:predicted nucleic acid-binding protein